MYAVHMKELLAICPQHGPFPSRANNFAGVQGLTLDGNTESCPQCGTSSRVVDGTFNISPEGIWQVLQAPGWTKQAIADAAQALQKARCRVVHEAEVPSWTQLVESVRGDSPQAADLLEASTSRWKRNEKIAFAGVLLTALMVLMQIVSQGQTAEPSISEEQLSQIIEESVSKAIQEGSRESGQSPDEEDGGGTAPHSSP